MIVLANCSLLSKIEIFVSTLKNERGERKTRTEREDIRRERKGGEGEGERIPRFVEMSASKCRCILKMESFHCHRSGGFQWMLAR